MPICPIKISKHPIKIKRIKMEKKSPNMQTFSRPYVSYSSLSTDTTDASPRQRTPFTCQCYRIRGSNLQTCLFSGTIVYRLAKHLKSLIWQNRKIDCVNSARQMLLTHISLHRNYCWKQKTPQLVTMLSNDLITACDY